MVDIFYWGITDNAFGVYIHASLLKAMVSGTLQFVQKPKESSHFIRGSCLPYNHEIVPNWINVDVMVVSINMTIDSAHGESSIMEKVPNQNVFLVNHYGGLTTFDDKSQFSLWYRSFTFRFFSSLAMGP